MSEMKILSIYGRERANWTPPKGWVVHTETVKTAQGHQGNFHKIWIKPAPESEPEEPISDAEAAEPEDEIETEADDNDLSQLLKGMTKKQLQKLCKESDLSFKGTKAELVKRLLEAEVPILEAA